MNLDIQQKKRETVPKGMKESGPTILEMGGKIETTREVKDAKDRNDICNDLEMVDGLKCVLPFCVLCVCVCLCVGVCWNVCVCLCVYV